MAAIEKRRMKRKPQPPKLRLASFSLPQVRAFRKRIQVPEITVTIADRIRHKCYHDWIEAIGIPLLICHLCFLVVVPAAASPGSW